MKIALACSQFPPTRSGYARHASELTKALFEAGHDIQVITEGGRGCSRIGKVPVLSDEGRSILNKEYDIVQVIGPSPLFSEQVVRYARKRGHKVVYAISAMPGLSSYFYNPLAPLIDRMYERLSLKRTLKNVDVAIFNTEDYAASFRWFSGPYFVVPHGMSSFCPGEPSCLLLEKYSLNNGTPRLPRDGILFVGQLRKYKGISYLIHALKKVHEIGLQTDLKIVGDGPDAGRLRKLVSDLGLSDYVSFLGTVEEDELHEAYVRSSMLVLPSLFAESFGIVLLEASAHGLPVIASSLPGVRELVWRLGGIPVAPGDSSALAEAIIRTLANPSFALSRGNQNGGKLERTSSFVWRNVAQKYVKVYERLLQRGSSSFISLNEEKALPAE